MSWQRANASKSALAFALGLGLQASACEVAGGDAGALPAAWVEIRDARVSTEVVEGREEQARGLGYRDSLAWDHGMLFVYPDARFLSFWMKGMRFDIDMVWILDGRIVQISHRVPHLASPEGPWPGIRPDSLADQVLEVPAGYAASHGWRTGDRVQVEPAAASSS